MKNADYKARIVAAGYIVEPALLEAVIKAHDALLDDELVDGAFRVYREAKRNTPPPWPGDKKPSDGDSAAPKAAAGGAEGGKRKKDAQ